MTDNTTAGKVISYVSYDDFGSLTAKAILKIGVRELDLVQDFTGHAFDMVLGIYYAKARMYDADDRRFMAVDPFKGSIVNPQTLVQYNYVLNNPLKYVDPFGLAVTIKDLQAYVLDLITYDEISIIYEATTRYNAANLINDYEGMVNAHSDAVAIRYIYDPNYIDDFDYTFNRLVRFSKAVPLGKGWWTREDSNEEGQNRHGGKHRHIFKDNKGWTQHENGDPSHEDAKKTLPGDPPRWLKEKVKEKTGWDWDEKEEQRQAREAENKVNSLKYQLLIPSSENNNTLMPLVPVVPLIPLIPIIPK